MATALCRLKERKGKAKAGPCPGDADSRTELLLLTRHETWLHTAYSKQVALTWFFV